MKKGVLANVDRFGADSYSAAQHRTALAALHLFARHGVSGTSLQMIADATGVTKAAIYHQFKTKEAIVVAAVDLELATLQPAIEAAEAQQGEAHAADTLLMQVIDLAIARRRVVGSLLHDPVIVRLLAEHAPYRQFMDRLFGALVGEDDSARRHALVAMVATAIGGVATHPLVADLDDETLRSAVLDLSLRMLELDT